MKVWNYVVFCTTLMVLLALAGFETGLDGILSALGINLNEGISMNTSSFWDVIFGSAGIFAGITIGTGIAVTGFALSGRENYLILPLITGTLGAFVQTFMQVINLLSDKGDFFYGIIILIMAPMTIGYIIALVEFFRGTD